MNEHHGIHPAIIALLRDLPQPEKTWTMAERERFLIAFRALIQHVYPPKHD